MQSRGKRWFLAVMLIACLVVAIAGAAWAGPSTATLADDPPTGVAYDTVEIAPSADTWLNAWDTTRNYGASWTLSIRSGDLAAPLLRFDLDAVPVQPNVTIAKSTLHVYVSNRTNAKDLTLATCQVLKPWVGSEATWERASADVLWQTAGCNGAEDRAGAIAAPLTLTETGMWVELEVTELVRAWYRGEAENYGVILKSMPGGSVNYEIISSESMYSELHPFLEVTYGLLPTPTVTTTPSPTPTPLPMLDIVKTGPKGPLEVSGEELIDYTIIVANNREYDFTGVLITDALPLGTEFIHGSVGANYDVELSQVSWSMPSLVSGESVTLTLRLGVPSWVKADGNVVNAARADCAECYDVADSYWEIPVNVIATPVPTLPPMWDLYLPVIAKNAPVPSD